MDAVWKAWILPRHSSLDITLRSNKETIIDKTLSKEVVAEDFVGPKELQP
jgi:hypothetical protein